MKVRDLYAARPAERPLSSPSPLSQPAPSSWSCPQPTIYQELAGATPSADTLAAFPDWQGLLVKSSVLGMSVWVVRNHLDGIALAKETGLPAVLLDDILRQKGKTEEEARASILPVLITIEQ